MKRFFKLLSVVFLVVMLSGCIKQTVHMDITKEEITIEVTNAMDSSLMTEEDAKSRVEELKADGFNAKLYESKGDENYVGVVYSKTYKLDDVSSSEAVEFHLENIDTELENGNPKIFKKDGTVYSANIIFDTASADTGDYSAEDLQSYADQFEISYSVTLPVKAKSNNADKVDGKTYTWNISYGEKAEIKYEFDTSGAPSSSSMLIFIIIGAVVVVAIVVIFIVARPKGNKNQPVNMGTGMPNQMPNNNMVNNQNPMPTEPGVYVNNGTQQVVPPTYPTDQNQNMQ